jgi:hypothetical protein
VTFSARSGGQSHGEIKTVDALGNSPTDAILSFQEGRLDGTPAFSQQKWLPSSRYDSHPSVRV